MCVVYSVKAFYAVLLLDRGRQQCLAHVLLSQKAYKGTISSFGMSFPVTA